MPASGFAGFAAAAGGAGSGALTLVLVPVAGALAGWVGLAGAVVLGAAFGACAAIVGVTAGVAVLVEVVPEELLAAAPPQPASARLRPTPPTFSIREGVQCREGRIPAGRVTRSMGSVPDRSVRLERERIRRSGGEIERVFLIAPRSIETDGRRILARFMGCPFCLGGGGDARPRLSCLVSRWRGFT
jgi:hypothetical protein